MGLSNAVNNILQSVSGNTPKTKPQNMEEVILNTAESHLAHEAKIEALNKLLETDDMDVLRQDDRDKVRQYEMSKFGWREDTTKDRKKKMGHILGDVTIQQSPNKTPISGLLVPLAAIATAGFLAHEYMKGNDQQPAAVVDTDTDTDSINVIQPGFGTPEFVVGPEDGQ